MPLEADLELAKFLTARGLITADQVSLGFLFATTRPDGKKLSLAEGLVARGFLSQDLVDGVLSVRSQLAALPPEPKDLEGRLLVGGRLLPRDLGRVKRIRGEVKKVLPDSVPTIGQVILHTRMMDLEALREYYDSTTESPGPSGPASAVPPTPVVPVVAPAPAPPVPPALRRRATEFRMSAPASSRPAADEPTPVKLEEPTPVKRGGSGLLPAFDGPVVSMPAAETESGETICGICKLPLLADQPRKSCETCRRIYHLMCWNPRTGCPQATCKQLRSTLDFRVIHSGPSAAVQWLRHYARILVSSTVMLIVGVWLITLVHHDADWYYRRSKEAREGATSTQRFQRMTDPRHGIEVDDTPEGVTAGKLDQERVAKQVEYLRQAIALDPRMVPAWFDLGTAGMELGDGATAREGFDAVVRLDEKNALARLALGTVYERDRDFAGAERLYRSAVALAPESADSWRRLAWLLDGHRPEARAEAVECYARVVALVPTDEDSRIRRAIAEVRLSRPEAALPVLEELRTKHPDRSELVLAIAMAHRDLGHWSEAADRAEEITSLEPGLPEARLVWADALVHLGRHARAIEVLDPIATDAQKDGAVFRLRGESQAALWDKAAALASVRRAAELDPSPATLLAQARVMARFGLVGEATAVARALQHDAPRTPGLALLLAALLLGNGDAEGAGQALAGAPPGAERDLLEVRRLRVSGALDAAEARVRAELEKSDVAGAMRIEEGLIALARGEPSRALGPLRQALDAHEPKAWAALAGVYRRFDETARAACAYGEFLRAIPFGIEADEARAFLANLDPSREPHGLALLGEVLKCHEILSAPAPNHRRRTDQIAGWLAELAVLVRLPTAADTVTAQEANTLRARAEAYAREPAIEPASSPQKEAEQRENDLRRALGQWAQFLVAGLQAMDARATQEGLEAPGAVKVSERLAETLGQVESEKDDARRCALALTGWCAFLAFRAERHPDPAALSARLEEIERRRATEQELARGAFPKLAAQLFAFAEGAIATLDTLKDRPVALAAAGRCRARLVRGDADACDALDQLGAAAQAACEALQMLDLLAGDGWTGGPGR